MIYLVLVLGPAGLAAALYGRTDYTRVQGAHVAAFGFAVALLYPEMW